MVSSWAQALTNPADQLQMQLGQLQSWSTDFNQTVTDANGEVLQTVKGRLDLQKPLQFYWQTQNPFPQVIVSNGTKLWIYDQDLEQVVIKAMSADVAPLPAALLSGQMKDIEAHYKVTQKVAADKTPMRTIFTIETKTVDGAHDFSQIKVQFEDNLLTSLTLLDALEQSTVLQFSNQSLNKKFAKTRFDFKTPKGVDVIDEQAKLSNAAN